MQGYRLTRIHDLWTRTSLWDQECSLANIADGATTAVLAAATLLSLRQVTLSFHLVGNRFAGHVGRWLWL